MGDQITESTALCPTCGTDLRTQARFCDGCGSPVAANRSVGERKQVTVLFTDVVGSMKLAATLEPSSDACSNADRLMTWLTRAA